MMRVPTIARNNVYMAVVLFSLLAQWVFAEELPKSVQAKVVIKEIHGAFYPPISNMAGVGGDVDVGVNVRQDGSIESAWVMKGPALLNQTSIKIAKRAVLECQNCGSSGADYVMHLRFEPGKNLGNCGNSTNGIVNGQWQREHSQDEVIIPASDRVLIRGKWTCLIVDYASYRARAPKCFYLWKCKLVPYEPVFRNTEGPDLPHRQDSDKSTS